MYFFCIILRTTMYRMCNMTFFLLLPLALQLRVGFSRVSDVLLFYAFITSLFQPLVCMLLKSFSTSSNHLLFGLPLNFFTQISSLIVSLLFSSRPSLLHYPVIVIFEFSRIILYQLLVPFDLVESFCVYYWTQIFSVLTANMSFSHQQEIHRLVMWKGRRKERRHKKKKGNKINKLKQRFCWRHVNVS